MTAGNAQVAATWQLPASDGGADLTTVYAEAFYASNNNLAGYVTLAPTATSATVTGLQDGTTYYLSVMVQNRSGKNSTAQSGQFTPKAGPQPAPPATIAAQPGNAQAVVTWTAPTDNGGSLVTGYIVTTYDANNNVVGTPINTTALTATVTGLTNGSSYYFGAAATNSAGSGPAAYSTRVTPATVPGAPTGVTAYPANRSVFVSWTPPTSTGGAAITGYTVTASGPGGTTNQTSTTTSLLVTGLTNGIAYTFTVAAANWAGTGAASAPSNASTPSGTAKRPVGQPRQNPQPGGSQPSVSTDEQRYQPVISGNGRFIFYMASPFNRFGTSGWFRYDLETGQEQPVWVFPSSSTMTWYVGSDIASASYDGQVFASFSGTNLYVWRADTGKTVLASANASGNPTVGTVSNPSMSADGNTLAFVVGGSNDMADHSTCAFDSTGLDTSNYSDLYRFNTVTNQLTRVPLNFSVPNATVNCVEADWMGGEIAPGLSSNASRMVTGMTYRATTPDGWTRNTRDGLLTIDMAGGSPAETLLCPGCPVDRRPVGGRIALSHDGHTVVMPAYDPINNNKLLLVHMSPDAPNAAPVAFADDNKLGVVHLSGDGKTVEAPYMPGTGVTADYGLNAQDVAIDVNSGQVTVASQVNGQLATSVPGDPFVLEGSIDDAGNRIALATNSSNLLGRTDCQSSSSDPNAPLPICAYNIVVVDLVTGTVGVVPSMALGCNCGGSLAMSAPFQNFVGDPVNTATGAFTEAVEDATLPATGPAFDFRRSYDSAAAGANGILGPGWSEPYAMSITVDASGNATLTAENGAKSVFAKQSDGSYLAPAGVQSKLAAVSSGGFTLVLPSMMVDTFDASGRLVSMLDRSGRGLTMAYSGSQLTTVTDSGGRQVGFAYDPTTTHLAKITMPDGRSIGYGYDASGRLSTVTDAAGKATTYGYDSANRLTTITDANGHVQVQNTYDPASGRVTSQIQAGGAQPQISWDAANEVATTTDASGRVTKDYYSGNVLIAHVDPGVGETSYSYDTNLNLVAVVDPEGHTTQMTYDAAGNMLSRTTAAPNPVTESWTYDAHHDVLTHTDARGNATTYTYDGSNRPSTVTDPAGGKTSFTYTASGQVATVTDPDGGVTTSSYDAAGNLIAKTDPAGGKTTYTYDAAGRALTVVDPRGNVPGADPTKFTTTYTYDAAGKAATRTDPDGHTTTNSYDAAGNLVSSKDPTGAVTTYGYDSLNRQISVTDALGHTTTTTYDPQGEVVATTDAVGGKTTYSYDAAGRLISSVSPLGNVSGADPTKFTRSYGYDAAGNQISVKEPLGNTTDTTFDALNRPVAVNDPAGNTTATAYDANGNVTAVTDPTGAVTKKTYDADNRLTAVTDPLGHTTSYTYDAAGHLLTMTSSLGEVTSYTYDLDGRVLTVTDPRGHVSGADPAKFTTTYAYDAAGNQLSVTNALGYKTTTSYDPAGLVASTTDPLGYTTGFGYDAAGRRTGVTDPNGHASTSAFDAVGNLLADTDPLGDKTSYTYDPANRRISATSARGNVAGAIASAYTTSYGYDAAGNQTSIAGPTGAVTTMAYDANGRRVSDTDALGGFTGTTYDPDSNIIVVTAASGAMQKTRYDADNRITGSTDPLGHTTTITYDAVGHRLTQTSPLGEVTSWTYDSDGRVSGATDPRGNVTGATASAYTTTFGYDAAGNQTSTTDPLGNTSTVAVDAAGFTTAATDANGHGISYTYDAAGHLTRVTDAAGDATSYSYDPVGNLLTRTDANSHANSYSYDNANRLTKVTDPLNRTVGYSYDPDGNQITITNARGQTITRTYDARNLLAQIAYSDGTPSQGYGYDADGHMTSASDATGSHTFTYDADGHLTGATAPSGGAFAYSYDAAGNITTRTYPDGAKTGYSLDADNRITGQTLGGAATAFTYDPAGHLTAATGPAAAQHYTYDGNGRLSSATSSRSVASVGTWQVSRDKTGQPTSVATSHNGATWTTTYSYDPAGRLLSACPSTGTNGCTSTSGSTPGITFTYDKVGNRLTQSESAYNNPPTTTGYTYDAADELTQAVGPHGTTSYGYDQDGNQTTVTPPADQTGTVVTARTFDAADRIASETLPVAGTVKFTYDAFDNRAGETWGDHTARLTWDTNNTLPQLASRNDGTATSDYSYDPLGHASSVTSGSQTNYLLTDWQGNVTDVADATGNPVGTGPADYGANGQTSSDISSLASGLLGFDSQIINPDNASYNLRARQYDPTTGRFLSRDPISQPATKPYMSAYVYADDSPTALTDPSGQTPQTPGGPDGFYQGGGTEPHDFAVEMAADQMVAIHGFARNDVYADRAGYYGWQGAQWTVDEAGKRGAQRGRPDLVVRKFPTNYGRGYAVWDVKSAWGDGIINAADAQFQLESYAYGIHKETGKPAVLGSNIIEPQYRYYPEDKSIITIFSAEDWESHAPVNNYGEKLTIPPTDHGSEGIIFYSRFKLYNRRDGKTPTIAEYAKSQAGQRHTVQLCKPLGTMPGGLRLVGHLGGAGTAASDLAARLTSDNGVPRQLVGVVNPMPFPPPPPPPPAVSAAGYTSSSTSFSFGFGGDVFAGGLATVGFVGAMIVAPEVAVPALVVAAVSDAAPVSIGLAAA